jgi:hypothetical protein
VSGAATVRPLLRSAGLVSERITQRLLPLIPHARIVRWRLAVWLTPNPFGGSRRQRPNEGRFTPTGDVDPASILLAIPVRDTDYNIRTAVEAVVPAETLGEPQVAVPFSNRSDDCLWSIGKISTNGAHLR